MHLSKHFEGPPLKITTCHPPLILSSNCLPPHIFFLPIASSFQSLFLKTDWTPPQSQAYQSTNQKILSKSKDTDLTCIQYVDECHETKHDQKNKQTRDSGSRNPFHAKINGFQDQWYNWNYIQVYPQRKIEIKWEKKGIAISHPYPDNQIVIKTRKNEEQSDNITLNKHTWNCSHLARFSRLLVCLPSSKKNRGPPDVSSSLLLPPPPSSNHLLLKSLSSTKLSSLSHFLQVIIFLFPSNNPISHGATRVPMVRFPSLHLLS